MANFKRVLASLLAVCVAGSVGVFSASAATTEEDDSVAASSSIKVHYFDNSGSAPSIYYWNSLPVNKETSYPGKSMQSAGKATDGYKEYTYTFDNVSKINVMFVEGDGTQTSEFKLTNNECWIKNNRLYSHNPYEFDSWDRTDMREDSIYFVITTRFYDGDTGNNVHCWDDKKANNPDSDPAWRGDFKGLAEKLDYIKALGFSAIWVTPVVTNGGGYDYHGYHAMDFATVDARYESDDFDYSDLILAAHEKGMKIIQDVVWNHTGNFGEATLCPMFTKEYNSIQDLGSPDSMKVIPGSELDTAYPNYDSMEGGEQFQARLDIMQSIHSSDHDMSENYHRETAGGGWGQPLEQYASIEGDCRDVNTENPLVAEYINSTYLNYVNEYGVDAFRLDTEKHINRWTLNSAYFPAYKDIKNFYIFGEVCARWSEFVNEGGPSDSPFFYTWAETESAWKNNWGTSFSDWETNFANSKKHYTAHTDKSTSGFEKSSNAFLNGVTYHTPDYSKANGTGVIDFTMHWNFENANGAWRSALSEDQYFNDSTWNVVYVDSHDYSPQFCEKVRYTGSTQNWAENMDLMFTFRGIPCVYYGSETEFQKGAVIDVGPNAPLSTTGRAYFGESLEGNVTATDFSEYTASGTVASTLNSALAVHLRQLNAIRRAVPALQKGQYTTSNVSGGNMAFTRRYTANGVDSLACVAISGGATFKNLPNGTYIDAVTGDTKQVTNGTLTVPSIGTANMRVYVCCASGFKGISGKVGTASSSYLK
ncbi:MAG: alpha-amylase family glycosyl hydrolase [Ruminococcus sp.]|nr:alpha-amylase family glycosyl hydrolase [Ruminococcus sp.]